MGKLSAEDLKELLRCIRKDSRVIVPPSPGFDSGVHEIGNKYVVVSTDPCIGVPEEWFGWLLIHYAASDVALFGAKPEYCTITLLGPSSTEAKTFHKIMRQTCKVADDLEMAIVTGHTGTYKGLLTLVGICTAYGIIDKNKLITPNGAKPSDYILCTKSLGLEILVNFSLTQEALAERLFGKKCSKELAELVYMQSCVKEALLLAEISGVHALHDATEGGLVAALNEMAETAKVGFKIDMEKISIPKEIEVLKKVFKLTDKQVLSMSSTGTVLAAVDFQSKDKAVELLHKKGVDARVIGVFTEDLKRILTRDGKETVFPRNAEDPYDRILSGKV